MGSRIEAKREKYRKYAERIALFNGLPPEFVRQIVHAGERVVYQQGAVVLREGAPCNAALIVFKGQLSLYEKGIFLRKCTAGESCCEVAALLRDFKSPTVTADMDTLVLWLEDHAVRKLLDMREGGQFALNFARLLGERSLANQERILRLHHALREHDEAASDRIAQQAFEAKAKSAPL